MHPFQQCAVILGHVESYPSSVILNRAAWPQIGMLLVLIGGHGICMSGLLIEGVDMNSTHHILVLQLTQICDSRIIYITHTYIYIYT